MERGSFAMNHLYPTGEIIPKSAAKRASILLRKCFRLRSSYGGQAGGQRRGRAKRAVQMHGYGSGERWLSLPRTDNYPYERPMVIPRADSRLWVRRPTVIPSTDPWLWGTRRSIRLGFHYTPLVAVSIPVSRQRLVLAGINRASGGTKPSSTPKRGGENRCRNKTKVIINFTYPYCIVKISMVQCAYLCI